MKTQEEIFDQEQIYSEAVYKEKWHPKILNPREFELRYSVPLRNGGGNLRFRSYKAQFDFLLQSEGVRYLDCACGAGDLAIWLAKNGKKVCAFDFAQSAIGVAQKSAEKSGVADGIAFKVMDARTLDYDDDYFDVITGLDCIHHLIKYPDAIREIVRVLKPGGKAVFVEPLTGSPLVNILRAINIKRRGYIGEHMLTRHDLDFLKGVFGDLKISQCAVFSTFSKLIAGNPQQITGIRKMVCIMLDSFDVLICKKFSFLNKYASVGFLELTKTISRPSHRP